MSDWQEKWDEEGNAYYENATTGETSWDPPQDDENDPNAGGGGSDKKKLAAMKKRLQRAEVSRLLACHGCVEARRSLTKQLSPFAVLHADEAAAERGQERGQAEADQRAPR